jgi:hypothetical protein
VLRLSLVVCCLLLISFYALSLDYSYKVDFDSSDKHRRGHKVRVSLFKNKVAMRDHGSDKPFAMATFTAISFMAHLPIDSP